MKFVDWGLIDYEKAVAGQLEILSQVKQGADDTVIFCSHPPVVTLGRSSSPEDLLGWKGPVVECSRGGRATYHGPHQLVIYPIVNLARDTREKDRDVGAYLRNLESCLTEALRAMGLKEVGPRPQVEEAISPRGEHWTGIWVGQRKIASIGIAVKHWITYHGAALNLGADEVGFSGIRPCGFSNSVMTSLDRELGQAVDRNVCLKILEEKLKVL